METFDHKGRTYSVTIERDYDHGHPWDEECGHGPVSEWTTRPKHPGELILCEERGKRRYYDFAEACRIALADGWDAEPYNTGTKRQQATRAAMADFDTLRRYAKDDWYYVGVVVTQLCKCCQKESDWSESMWGIDSESDVYIESLLPELAEEIEYRQASHVTERLAYA